ncbi:hypothetical protein [Actinomadura rugatobispora]|uniref:Uncharacterized protein n=1 Tax=Actinomadura rugatobispora TaxID=1994 RepID=A0ABW1AJ34_9ACTN|nr:hypothetical protein GCM10010200_046900 [Actinomadura rugatobispora]
MAERIGGPVGADGRHPLLLPDDATELVDEELLRHDELDAISHGPRVDFRTALRLDGPLAGQTAYAVNELGSRSGFYELVELAEGEMRLVGLNGRPLP